MKMFLKPNTKMYQYCIDPPICNIIKVTHAELDNWQFKGIVYFEIIVWYVLAYLKDIQDVGVFVSTVF